MSLSPINQTNLFTLDNYLLEFVELYKKKKLPTKILLSGDKGLGKSGKGQPKHGVSPGGPGATTSSTKGNKSKSKGSGKRGDSGKDNSATGRSKAASSTATGWSRDKGLGGRARGRGKGQRK